ncbi:hypothetical protein TRICI_004645 [Trichomonascus ciferrii]|uniref:ER transporter 6TM N-terminal domain-containing protein n=1 Tax=Trichomonascus ciferrii TaxID=44093 RepID=A0A642V5A3_9ASCO|nr:hypothetical protein TRICI_004645 [Trichomonascus ciferrii]
MSKESSSSPKQGDSAGSPSTKSQQSRFSFTLPAWLDHFNSRDLKVVFRCWVAIWVMCLLMFINPSLQSIGLATFFGALLLFIVPPAGILFVYLIGAFSLLFGMCLAWAWGLISMKAALAARPESETQRMLEELQVEASRKAQETGESVSWAAQTLIHDGFMFDTRVTVVFYVMCCVFVYFMARLRVANHKFALAETFGDVVIDLFLLFGPSLPSFNGMLPKVLIEPAAIGLGIGAACCLLFFPQSTSYAVLGKIEQTINITHSSLKTTQKRLAGERPEISELQAVRGKTVAAFKAMQPMLTFLPLDFSRGKWSAEDVKGLWYPMRQAVMAHLTLLDVNIARLTHEKRLEEAADPGMEKPAHGIAHRHLVESENLIQVLKAPELGDIRKQATEVIRETTTEVLQITSECVTFITESIHTVNSRRWMRAPSQEHLDDLVNRGEEIHSRLEAAQGTCVENTTELLIQRHSDLFGENGELRPTDSLGPHALRSLVMGMVTEEYILRSAKANNNLLAHILVLLRKRKHNRIWFPRGLRHAATWLKGGTRQTEGLQTVETGDNPNVVEEQTNEAYRLLNLSRGYGSRRKETMPLIGRMVRHTYRWLTNPGGIYAIRMVVVTIATALPASIASSAGFFYREKGIWGTITAQIAVLIYMSDFTFSVLGRAFGTIVGGVVGMVAWYIGSGSGPGNPYGLAAITAVAVVLLLWMRLFLPPMFTGFSVMCGATFSLVIGFSYDDEHLKLYGLPGHGYEAFYKRVVTVLLGLLAAFIVQVIPRPPSANRHIRKTLSSAVHKLSDHYALLLSHWNRDDATPIDTVSEQISLNLADSLLSLQGPIGLLNFEISLGSFDRDTLRRTQQLCQSMNQALAGLLGISDILPLRLQERLVYKFGFLDDHMIASTMAVLEVIEQAIKSGDPLPERLPIPLLNRSFDWHEKHPSTELSVDLIRDEHYRTYCVAVSSYLKFLSAIDDLVIVLKKALGESHIVHRSDHLNV